MIYAAYIATAVILVTYFQVQRGHGTRWFDWSNAVGCVPLAVSAALVGAWPSAIVSASFGAIAWYGHVRGWLERRALWRWSAALREDSRSDS